jgi:ABC-type phosphate/phosphonate transport system substrate-binding protein
MTGFPFYLKPRDVNFERSGRQVSVMVYQKKWHPILRCLGRTWMGALLLLVALSGESHADDSSANSFRIGFSRSMFTDVNENDVLAAVKVWGHTVAKESHIPTVAEPFVFKEYATMLDALRRKQIDVMALTLVEFGPLSKEINFGPIFVADTGERFTVQYILLVHGGGVIRNVSELKGRSIAFHQNSMTCLSEIWLDTLLCQNGLPSVRNISGKVTTDTKLGKVVLPVFFRQADACVVTQSGFETLKELNPQLEKQLKIIATSSEIVPALFAFRADYAPPFKADLMAALHDLHKSPAGHQVLTIFKCDRIEEQPINCLKSGLDLMAIHERLNGEGKPR